MLKCETGIVYRCYFACSYTDSRGKFVYLICGGESRNRRSLNRRQTYDCVCPVEIRKFNSFVFQHARCSTGRLVKLHVFDDYYARVHHDNRVIAILERVSILFYIECKIMKFSSHDIWRESDNNWLPSYQYSFLWNILMKYS